MKLGRFRDQGSRKVILGFLIGLMFTSAIIPVAAVVGSWSASGSSLYYNDGNVGVGTSSPGARLEVANSDGTQAALAVSQQGVTDSNYYHMHAIGTNNTSRYIFGRELMTASSGDVILGGEFVNLGNDDGVIQKFNPAGELQWMATEFVTQNPSIDYYTDLAETTNYYIGLARVFNTVVEIRLRAFKKDGTELAWEKTITQDAGFEPTGIVVDNSDNIYVLSEGYKTANLNQISIYKFQENGTKSWDVTYTDSSAHSFDSKQILLDSTGNIFVFASHYSPTTGRKLAQIKFNSSGTFQWAKLFATGALLPDAAALIDGSNFIVTMSNLSLGKGYIMKISTAGSLVWAKKYNETYGFNGIAVTGTNEFATLPRLAADGGSEGIMLINGSGVVQEAVEFTDTTDDYDVWDLAATGTGFIVSGKVNDTTAVKQLMVNLDKDLVIENCSMCDSTISITETTVTPSTESLTLTSVGSTTVTVNNTETSVTIDPDTPITSHGLNSDYLCAAPSYGLVDRFTVADDGNVGIGNMSPLSPLQVEGYIQTDYRSGAPAAADCDANNERGRTILDYQNNRLYVCNGATRGWDYIGLTN